MSKDKWTKVKTLQCGTQKGTLWMAIEEVQRKVYCVTNNKDGYPVTPKEPITYKSKITAWGCWMWDKE